MNGSLGLNFIIDGSIGPSHLLVEGWLIVITTGKVKHHIRFPVGLSCYGNPGTDHGGLVEIPNGPSQAGCNKYICSFGIYLPGILKKGAELIIGDLVVGSFGFAQDELLTVIGD